MLMRYHIDTIPLWDAMKLEGECLLCALERKTELGEAERYLGASVMEPDTRIQVNAKGFCGGQPPGTRADAGIPHDRDPRPSEEALCGAAEVRPHFCRGLADEPDVQEGAERPRAAG